MEQKKFVSDLLFVQAVNILIKAVWILVIDRAVQNLLPADDYGKYFTVFSFTVIFIILLDLGINSFNTRSVAIDKAFYHHNFFSILTIKVGLAMIFLAIALLMAFLIGWGWEYVQLLIPLALFQIFVSMNQYLRSNLSGVGRFRWDGIVAVTDRTLVVIVLGSWMLVDEWSHMLTIRNFVIVQVVGVVIAFILGFVLNRLFLGKPMMTWRMDQITSLMKKALPFALLAALMALYTRVDAVMIDFLLDSVQTDRYAMSYRLLDAGSMIAVLLSGMLLPLFSKMIEDNADLSETVRMSLRLLVIPAALVAILVSAHSFDLLSLMYSNKVEILSSETFTILMFSFISTCLIYIFGTLLTAAADLRYLNTLAAICVGLNVFLNAILISETGIEGAAIATLLTQLVFALGCVFRSQRRHQVFTQNTWMIGAALKIGAFALMYFLTEQYFDNHLVHMSVGAGLAFMIVVHESWEHIGMLKGLNRRKT